MEAIIIGLIVVLAGVLLLFIPDFIYRQIESVFSLGDLGIRNIPRRHDKTDTLANFCLFFALVFSIFYFVIPFYNVFYMILLIISFLVCLAQTSKVTKKTARWERCFVIYCVYLMAGIGFVSSTGLLNSNSGDALIQTFGTDLFGGQVFDVFYILTNPSIMVYLLQAVLFLIPMYCMWAQFKYMRLEKTYKGINVFTFLIKVLFICFVMVYLSIYGFDFINLVYQVEYKEA